MLCFRSILVSVVVLCGSTFVSTSVQASSFADFVVSYNAGTSPAAGFTNTAVVLGAPTASATITAPPFQKTQILSLGFGGSLVVGFNSPISNNPANPFGLDFTIFNNSFFTLGGTNINGAFTHPGLTVYASQDDTNFYLLSSSTNNGADGLYPTAGGGNPFLPVNPALGLASFTGGTTSNALALYNGSAGGASYDLSSAIDTNGNPVSLSWISYVEVINTSATSVGEIDAFAVVPEPSSLALVVTALGLLLLKRHRRIVLGVAIGLFATQSTFASTNLAENFSSNPFGTWSFGLGDNSHNQFTWTNTPSVYTGDSNGELDVHLNSSLPTTRLQRPLGVTLTDTNDFMVSARFSFHLIANPNEQAIQISFGLVNSALTGGDRTGTEDDEGNFLATDNAFNTIEFDYFPSVSFIFDSGPSLTPTAIGAQKDGDDSFGNFATIFGPDSNLGDNANGLTELPQDVTLQATLTYYGASKTLILAMSRVNPDGSITPLDTGVTPMTLPTFGYDTNFPFNVDTLAIMAYQDGFTTTNAPSLIADLRFQKLNFTTSVPQLPNYVSTSLSGANVLVAFPTVSTNFYDIQSRTDLVSGSWSTIASNIAGTGGVLTNVDTGGATVAHRFYRVGVQVN